MARIVITGGRGFIGSHLEVELREAGGHEVQPMDRTDGDLRDYAIAVDALRQRDPEIVIHCAAQVGRLSGEQDVSHTIQSNATMTGNVARACGSIGARLVYVSTSEVYGDQGEDLCCEDGPMVLPHNLYGLSKRWGEEIAQLYAPRGLQVWRPSMPYGPGLPPGWGRAAIVNMLWQALHRKRILVHRGAARSWCWIGDAVRAMRLVLESGEVGAWNIGRDDAEVSMLHVARIACELTGAPLNLTEGIDPPSAQTVVKRLSTEKLRRLGWEPEVELLEGMKRTLKVVRHYDANAIQQPAAIIRANREQAAIDQVQGV